MRKFYLTYKGREPQIVQSGIGQLGIMQKNGIVQSPIGQLKIDHQSFPFKLSWTHYQVLMTIEDLAERSFYELEAINVTQDLIEKILKEHFEKESNSKKKS